MRHSISSSAPSRSIAGFLSKIGRLLSLTGHDVGERLLEPFEMLLVTEAEAALALTLEAYDHLAREYADQWFTSPVMLPWLERFLAEVVPGDAILDAGCGPGRDVAFFRERGREVVGIDLSSGMLIEARARVPGGV